MVELLAPAGDKECFKAALMAGADAVYVGGNRFGARAYARNFEQEDLIESIHLAHMFDRKVYLTVNTLMKEQELSGLTAFLKPYYNEGLDGVIVQDFGALSRIREAFPKLELHASTQMTVTGSHSAQLLKEYGVSRIVPARELSLSEITAIKEETGLEIETFIHGAMCYGYSGQCLFSSLLGQRSGNRGRCAGPCRLPYGVEYQGKRLNRENEAYQLSLKDLCVLEILPQLMEAGIDSYKIEGRMKTPEYVSFVTGMYRKYIDLYYQNPKQYHVSEKDLQQLRNRFSRGSIQSGYYFMHNGRELLTLDKAGYQSFEKTQESAQAYEQKDELKIDLNGHFVAIKDEPIYFTVYKKNCPETTVVVTGNVAGKAHKCAATMQDAEKQLKKTGGTCFRFEEIRYDMDDDLFLPNKELNDLRRRALSMLEERLLADSRREEPARDDSVTEAAWGDGVTETAQDESEKEQPTYTRTKLKDISRFLQVDVRTKEQLLAIEVVPQLKRVYLSTDALPTHNPETDVQFLAKRRKLQQEGVEFYLKFPAVCRRKAIEFLQAQRMFIKQLSPDGFCIGNPESLGFVQKEYPKAKLVTDSGMHLFNSATAAFYEAYGITEHIFSYELHKKEMEEIMRSDGGKAHAYILPVYGFIPAMESAGCLLKTNGKCRGGKGEEAVTLIDRQNKKRMVITHCDRCENTIYNSVPLSLHKETKSIFDMDLSGVLLRFTTETAEETMRLTRQFRKLYEAAASENDGALKEILLSSAQYEFTKGHFTKGVE